jgi:hypothetical protein
VFAITGITVRFERNRHTQIEISDFNGIQDSLSVNQKLNGGQWNFIGNYNLDSFAKLKIIHPGGYCTASADAVKFVVNTPTYQCSDGVDNDGDGLTDYPADPGCISAIDDDEFNPPPQMGDCPCGTIDELNAMYDNLVGSAPFNIVECWEFDHSSTLDYGYPPYTDYTLESCAGFGCDNIPEIVAGVNSYFPWDDTSRAHWNAECFVKVRAGWGYKYHEFNANLTRKEVEACSNAIKNSKWGQVVPCQ